MTLTEQVEKGESKTLELKKTLPKNENIAKTIIAFSNTSGGKLVIGVNDKRKVVGVNDAVIFEMQDKIASIIADNCSPDILPEIYSVNIEGKLVLVIEVVRGNLKPYFLKRQGKSDGTYIRLGATNRAANHETIAELERQKRNVSFDEEICYDMAFSNLDITPLLKKFEDVEKTIDYEKLKNLKLIKTESDEEYPTNALMIILGLFPHCTIKCARFKGNTMSVFTDKKEYEGDIFSILENTQSFVLNHINLKGEIKGLQRTDTYEIPVSALREALINAIIHRDYTNRGRDIKVGIYDDVVNIVSPGSLPHTQTIEDILTGRSEARNRVVARVFKELNLIEQWGSGIKRIIDDCESHGLPTPKIEEKNDFFDIEIIRPRTITTNYDRVEEKRPSDTAEYPQNTAGYRRIPPKHRRIPSDCSEQEKLILEYIQKHGSIKSKQAEELLSIKESRARD
jgi:ATP-dependent DNA helicase RecG